MDYSKDNYYYFDKKTFKAVDGVQTINDQTYTFTVESYLCGPDTDIYKAVKDFHIGDVIDLEGFLYWYEGPNPHITAVLAQ